MAEIKEPTPDYDYANPDKPGLEAHLKREAEEAKEKLEAEKEAEIPVSKPEEVSNEKLERSKLEQKWIQSENPKEMLRLLEKFPENDRSMRLFLCSCLRSVSEYSVIGKSGQEALEASEKFADNNMTSEDLAYMRQVNISEGTESLFISVLCRSNLASPEEASGIVDIFIGRFELDINESIRPDKVKQEKIIQANFLRDVFGNPFDKNSRKINRDWLDWEGGTVANLAQAAYDNRAKNGQLDQVNLMVLADALVDAGCPEDHQVVSHLRGPGPHVRGCWCLDLILGKG